MNFIMDFLRQEVPRSDKAMPAYYRRALFVSEAILTAFFLTGVFLLRLTTGRWQWPSVVALVAMAFCLIEIDHLSARVNLLCFSGIICFWLTWFVHMFGWAAGSPNILVPILSLAFFNIYVSPVGKVGYFLGLVAFRVLLFAYSLRHTPIGSLNHASNLAFQMINSVVPLLILAINYILFSSSIQASERQLTINNEKLHREAGTDPLTGLPNRRAMLEAIEKYLAENPDAQYTVAIADIDFFKKVNDSYGHNCGDYTLRELSRLFQSLADGRYLVCRWGGEEFCFFLPGMNLDEAGTAMYEINTAVKKLPLRFGDIDFSITITIGVEENDFQSPTSQILERADRKLYMGKVGGRDQVVI